jgi:hypothetical protein
MRVESRVTSLSWIPSEAVTGMMRLGFKAGLSHYDKPPTGTLGDLLELRGQDAFRFANQLSAWAEFEDGQVQRYGQDGGLVLGLTTVQVGPLDATFAAVPMPDLRPQPVIGDGWIRFAQTSGGRTALPLPRVITRAPFFRLQSPLVWTTLHLTLHADGHATFDLAGASPFPRHWVYDPQGALSLKAGVSDWKRWVGQPAWTATPWGDEDSQVVVAVAETALERELSALLMHGSHKPKVRTLAVGDALATQGEPADSLYLVLDGMLGVSVDGVELGDVGPGAVLGERAILESSPRTATLTALTPVRIAEAPVGVVDREALTQLAKGHQREVVGRAPSS